MSELQKILQLIGGLNMTHILYNLHLAADGTQTPKLDSLLENPQSTEETLLLSVET